MRQRLARVLIALAAAAFLAAAQQARLTHPITGRPIARIMGVQAADWLDRPEREREEHSEKALDLIGIRPGTTVADIGAGSGYYTVKLARRVGPTGRVLANDIQPPMLEIIEEKVAALTLTNVQTVAGLEDDPRLPPGAVDLALLVDVYHEFSSPQQMLRKIHEALKPDGRLVLLEFKKEDPTIPIRLDHKMTVDEAKREVEPEGFTLDRVLDDLPWQHILIFRKRAL